MVLINTVTIGKLNQSTVVPSLFNESSDFHTVFFRAWHKSKIMEKNRCILLFSRTISHFQGQFYKIPGQFQDKWHYFEIPGVFQDQDQIQGLFQVCANPAVLTAQPLIQSSSVKKKAYLSCDTSSFSLLYMFICFNRYKLLPT